MPSTISRRSHAGRTSAQRFAITAALAWASAKIVVSFPDADAFGFMCGSRSNITVLDVDSKDERILADAINRHGNTPIIARSGSGHFQAWYKHNGERRQIRPDRNVPIDILGTNGYVVGPPSQVTRGDYQFIEGSLDDLHNLPALLNVYAAIEKPPILADEPAPADWVDMGEGDGRNNELYSVIYVGPLITSLASMSCWITGGSEMGGSDNQ